MDKIYKIFTVKSWQEHFYTIRLASLLSLDDKKKKLSYFKEIFAAFLFPAIVFLTLGLTLTFFTYL